MKQQNAFSFATLRISTVLAMLWALPVGPVSAIPIQLTSGGIFVETSFFPGTFFASSAALAGPGFLFTTNRLSDAFLFSVSSPNNPLDLLPPGTITSFSGGMQVVSGGDPGDPPGEPFSRATVIYGGESYFATGDIRVSTPTFVVGPQITLPFSLSGFIHANNFNGGTELDFEIFGAGTVTAFYGQYPNPGLEPSFYWITRAITYTIEPPPIPEPTSWLLLGSGLLGVAARRRSTRLKTS